MTLLIVILTQNFHAETKILVAYLELDKRLCLTSWWLVGPLCLSKKLVKIQLNPALTDFRRQKFSSVMSGLLLLPIKEIKEINLKGPWICVCFKRNSVGGGSIREGFNCTPLALLLHHLQRLCDPCKQRVRFTWIYTNSHDLVSARKKTPEAIGWKICTIGRIGGQGVLYICSARSWATTIG